MKPNTNELWREEFSIHGGNDRYVQRRQFTKFLVLTSFGMLLGNVWIMVRSWFKSAAPAYPRVSLGAAPMLGKGQVKLFQYPTPEDPCILIHTKADKYVAYSQKCTHLSCAVYYSRDNERIECPCHEGYFAVEDGRVLQGPPPRPLPQIVLERRGDELFATGVNRNAES